MDNMIDHYQAVLRDLELRRSRCKQELDELDNTIGGIKKLLSNQASLFVASPAPSPTANIAFKIAATAGASEVRIDHSRFSGMSVRWGILKLLAENAGVSPTAAEIAQTLAEGGMNSKGKDFGSNVSAVLSDMKNKRSEVANAGGQWALTATGHHAWEAIKATPQYRERISSFAATLQ
jgi:hypothetical protein